MPTEGTAHHLFAQKLCAEGTNAQDVSHGIGVPAFGQHRDGNNATHLLAEPFWLADGVHHLAQQVLVRDVVGGADVTRALYDLPAEAVDFICRHLAKVLVQRFAGLKLFRVDQERWRARAPVAVFVKVSEEREAAVFQRAGAVPILTLEARNVVVDKL